MKGHSVAAYTPAWAKPGLFISGVYFLGQIAGKVAVAGHHLARCRGSKCLYLYQWSPEASAVVLPKTYPAFKNAGT